VKPVQQQTSKMSNTFFLHSSAHGLKESGNAHFAEFTTRHTFMSHERKTAVLNRARQCYETSAQMCKDALDTKTQEAGGQRSEVGGHRGPGRKLTKLKKSCMHRFDNCVKKYLFSLDVFVAC
jgi:hypothetical protein